MLATEHSHCVGGVRMMSVFTLCGHVGADVAMCEDDKGCVCVCVCVCHIRTVCRNTHPLSHIESI